MKQKERGSGTIKYRSLSLLFALLPYTTSSMGRGKPLNDSSGMPCPMSRPTRKRMASILSEARRFPSSSASRSSSSFGNGEASVTPSPLPPMMSSFSSSRASLSIAGIHMSARKMTLSLTLARKCFLAAPFTLSFGIAVFLL